MILTDETFLLYAVKHYNNPGCMGMKEFQDDMKRFKYIKRLLKQYQNTGHMVERLVLNHIILLHNVFGDATVPLLFFKFEERYWPQLKTFLVFLDYLPDNCQIAGKDESEIPLDQQLIFKLRKI